MMETLTTFFHTFGWQTATLAIALVAPLFASFIYVDLKGTMKRITFFAIAAAEALVCSTGGFGDFAEMAKDGAMPVVMTIILYLLIKSWRDMIGKEWT